MSQLNNDEVKKINSNKTGKSRNKTIIIITILIIVLCLILTVVAIFINKDKKLKDNDIINQNEKVEKENNLKVTSLIERYANNSLKFETVEFKEGKKQVFDNYEMYKVEISYAQISGLKNKTVQDKINSEIKQKVFNLYNKKYLNDESIDRLFINADVTSNFGNILSVQIYGTITYKNNGQYTYDYFNTIGLNYKLETGEYLKLKDLFVASANLNNIVAQSKYLAMAWDELKEPGELNMNEIDTSKYEEEIFAYVNKFKEQENPEFYFTPSKLYLKVIGEKEYIPIDMAKYYDSIAIYKRYNDISNLYETKSLNNNKPFVFTSKSQEYTYMYDDVLDNLFVDIQINVFESEEAKKAEEKVKPKVEELVKEIKSKASANKNRGIAYKAMIGIYYNQNDNLVNVSYLISENSMSISYYKENIYSLIAEFERMPKASVESSYFSEYEDYEGNSNLVNNKNITINEISIDEKYDKNGNLVKDDDKKSQEKNNNTDKTDNSNSNDEVNIY